jgi:hypothetical protein
MYLSVQDTRLCVIIYFMNNTTSTSTWILNTVKGLTGPTRARIITRTPVKANKKDIATKTIVNPYTDAVKITTMIVELNPAYEQAVNNQREIEGLLPDFQAGARKWGTNIGNGIVQNGEQYYVSVICKETVLITYMNGPEILTEDQLKPFMPIRKSSNQDVANPIAFRSISIDNIYKLEIL